MHTIPLKPPRSRSSSLRLAPRLVSIATALPEHEVDQRNARTLVAALFSELLEGGNRHLLQVFDHSGVERRRVCMPLEWYARDHDLGETNALYVEHALRLATQVAKAALRGAGLAPRDVDHVVFVSSTGFATPSIDARLANVLGFRSDVRRTPIWGLGCAGGAVGLSRARDFALADPGARVLLIALELCSLTFQRGDLDRRNLVAASLFSDGAAAAVVTGARAEGRVAEPDATLAPSPPEHASMAAGRAATPTNGEAPVAIELLASRSTLWPDTLDLMGWTVDARGMHVVFSRDIPQVVRRWARPNLEEFLGAAGSSLEDLDHLIAHPGGPRVLEAYAEALALPEESLRHAREVLRTCGNMSSPTCLFVLERALAAGDLVPGETAVVAALGPGFSSEYVLVRRSA